MSDYEPINARIECSAKVLRQLGMARSPIGYGNQETDPLFTWYTDLFCLNGQKCLIYVNCLTRYPVIALYLSSHEIENINMVLGEGLKLILLDEGVSDSVISQFLEHLDRPEITKSNNRSIIKATSQHKLRMFDCLENPIRPIQTISDTQMSLRLARNPVFAGKEIRIPFQSLSNELLKRYGATGHFRFNPISMKPQPLQ